MENKTLENAEVSLTREPVLVDAIVEVLNKEIENIKVLLDRTSLLAQEH